MIHACGRDTDDCECQELEPNLKAIASGPASPAIMQALMTRAAKHGIDKGRLAEYQEHGDQHKVLVKVLDYRHQDGLIHIDLETVRDEGGRLKPGANFTASARPEYAGWAGWTLIPSDEHA